MLSLVSALCTLPALQMGADGFELQSGPVSVPIWSVMFVRFLPGVPGAQRKFNDFLWYFFVCLNVVYGCQLDFLPL